MMMIENDAKVDDRHSPGINIAGFRQFKQFSGHTYECRALLCPSNEGGFTAYALRLPGVVSEGDTIDDALDAISEAFSAAIEAYRENGMSIPWGDANIGRTEGCQERWILVDV